MLLTPVNVYKQTNLCVINGFSHVQTEMT